MTQRRETDRPARPWGPTAPGRAPDRSVVVLLDLGRDAGAPSRSAVRSRPGREQIWPS
jgi:hypothetical protein